MMPDTFEGRQAYIDKCRQEIRESEARIADSKAQYEAVNLAIQTAMTQYTMAMTNLIYRGMFDPNFCKPPSGDAGVDGG